MYTLPEIQTSPNVLAPFYSRFKVAERLLLTGHSHQAWPDCGFAAQSRAWEDAAEHVDGKWEFAFARATRVRAGYAHLLDDPDGTITLSTSTHDLLVRFLSALPLRERPRLVTTDGEFHTVRRQLDRLAEEQIEIVRVPAAPTTDLANRLSDAVDTKTAAVLVSAVMFQSGLIVPGLSDIQQACDRLGARLLIDAYHALNVAPFSIRKDKLTSAFVVGGGYKYCQLGEGNAFLRFPAECTLRPIITGWFSEFDILAAADRSERVAYGEGSGRFAGATYDPTSNYRAAAVFDFFEEHQLLADFLREVSQHQIGLLARRFDEADLDPSRVRRNRSLPLESIGGFLVLEAPQADRLSALLAQHGVFTDYRGTNLRLGPAPYLSDIQLLQVMEILTECVSKL